MAVQAQRRERNCVTIAKFHCMGSIVHDSHSADSSTIRYFPLQNNGHCDVIKSSVSCHCGQVRVKVICSDLKLPKIQV
jgi:hypothetical protein